MPAIRLTEFRRDVGAALAHLDEPQTCAQALSQLMARHGTPLYRAGQSVAQRTLPAYHLPPAAFSLMAQSLHQAVRRQPQAALPLAQALWADAHLEPRLLAARLIGLAPPDAAALTQFWTWLAEAQDADLRQALLTQGSQRFVHETPQAFLAQAVQALARPGIERRTALLALTALVDSPAFEAGPALYRALRPVLLHLEPEERPEAARLLQALAQRWPQEVGPFLSRVWGEAAAEDKAEALAWVIRRVLPHLPLESRQRLQRRLSA